MITQNIAFDQDVGSVKGHWAAVLSLKQHIWYYNNISPKVLLLFCLCVQVDSIRLHIFWAHPSATVPQNASILSWSTVVWKKREKKEWTKMSYIALPAGSIISYWLYRHVSKTRMIRFNISSYWWYDEKVRNRALMTDTWDGQPDLPSTL